MNNLLEETNQCNWHILSSVQGYPLNKFLMYEGKFVYDILDEHILLCGALVFFEDNPRRTRIDKRISFSGTNISYVINTNKLLSLKLINRKFNEYMEKNNIAPNNSYQIMQDFLDNTVNNDYVILHALLERFTSSSDFKFNYEDCSVITDCLDFENNQFIEQIIKIYSVKDDGITKQIADELRRNSQEFIISKI